MQCTCTYVLVLMCMDGIKAGVLVKWTFNTGVVRGFKLFRSTIYIIDEGGQGGGA